MRNPIGGSVPNSLLRWQIFLSAVEILTLFFAAIFGFVAACFWLDAAEGGSTVVVSSRPGAHVSGKDRKGGLVWHACIFSAAESFLPVL